MAADERVPGLVATQEEVTCILQGEIKSHWKVDLVALRVRPACLDSEIHLGMARALRPKLHVRTPSHKKLDYKPGQICAVQCPEAPLRAVQKKDSLEPARERQQCDLPQYLHSSTDEGNSQTSALLPKMDGFFTLLSLGVVMAIA